MKGGKRKNSGRKPGPDGKKVPVAFRFSPRINEYVKTLLNKTEEIETLLMRSSGFKKWDLSKVDK